VARPVCFLQREGRIRRRAPSNVEYRCRTSLEAAILVRA
jgi:hypothetical protein